ncbi:glycosyltransferase [Prochlorococcus sp. MIT 0604]|uniref:glycosyltransferase n=1 Tax=Prochlorococcus sp. MIT 0604 TaxID=1501268 RepID=UPI0004F8E743|nr:glycosyltransferase [Prochlorococcus sp. MIT 0604]AIQ95495.1 hypothetical protein EW14_1484 [Prochlorococcus sp. MIT 0604]
MRHLYFDNAIGVDSYTGIGYVSRVLLYTYFKIGVKVKLPATTQKENKIIFDLWEQAGNSSTIVTLIEKNYLPFKLNSIFKFYKLKDRSINEIFCPFQFPLLLSKQLKNNNISFKFIVHDLCYIEATKQKKFGFLKRYILNRRIKELSKYKKTKIFSPRNYTLKEINKKFGINKKKLIEIPIPYFFGREWDIKNNKYIIKYQSPYILFISNSRKRKGISLLKEIIEKSFPANFIIVGDTNLKNIFKSYSNVNILVNIPDPEVASLIINCSMLISTSSCEGLCLPVCRSISLNKKTAALNHGIYNSNEFKNLIRIDTNNINPLINEINSSINNFKKTNYNELQNFINKEQFKEKELIELIQKNV